MAVYLGLRSFLSLQPRLSHCGPSAFWSGDGRAAARSCEERCVVGRPGGTQGNVPCNPGIEMPGYCRMSLWDGAHGSDAPYLGTARVARLASRESEGILLMAKPRASLASRRTRGLKKSPRDSAFNRTCSKFPTFGLPFNDARRTKLLF
jgi:hypothetical protein